MSMLLSSFSVSQILDDRAQTVTICQTEISNYFGHLLQFTRADIRAKCEPKVKKHILSTEISVSDRVAVLINE